MINFSVTTEYSVDEETLAESMPGGFEGDAADLVERLLSDGVAPEDFGAEQEFQEVFLL